MSLPRWLRRLAIVGAVTIAYFAAGKLGLRFASLNPVTTAFWPPTGIALAACLVIGPWVWPGVWLAAFLVNLTTAGTLATSAGIATGNTLEALLGAFLVRRFASGRRMLDQASDIFRFALLAGLLSTTVSATVGVTTLVLGGLVPRSLAGPNWLTWWLGDAAGALVVAPLLVLWSRRPRFEWTPARIAEAAAFCVSLVGIALWVFRGQEAHWPIQFLCLPVLLWAAFRFTPREASSAVVALSAIAISSTSEGLGSFAPFPPNTSLVLLQCFLAVTSVTVLAVGATVGERHRNIVSIRQLNEALERRVTERTHRLEVANLELRALVRERGLAEQELRRSEARLQDAQEMARIGSWEWDIPRGSLWWSETMYSICGLDPASFRPAQETFLARIHPDDRERVRRTVAEALEGRGPFQLEHRLLHPEGRVLHAHSRGRMILDGDGHPAAILGTTQDISERRRAEEERAILVREQAGRREAEEANRLKDEFLATLSHELRNPLNAIVGWARLLREGRLDAATQQRAVDAINRSADLQSQLILDLLDLSRITSGRLELAVRPLDPVSVVEGVLESVRPAARTRGITLVPRFELPGQPVLGDPDRLQQVLWNLITNALRFGRAGGTVMISVSFAPKSLRIRVEDDGPGIEPELLPHLFDPFRQGRSRAARRHNGLGLGLAIAQRLVTLHGGTIVAANRSPGPGAVFTIELPLATPIAAEAHALEAPDAPKAPAAPSTATRSLAGKRVLVVEDMPESRELLRTLLSRRGAQVEVAESCVQALDRFRSNTFDILISDIEMPDESGYDLIARVRALPPARGGRIPAVAVTAYAGTDDARRALRSGYQAHVAKPFEGDTLVAILEELVREGPPGD